MKKWRRKTSQVRILRRLIIALVLALCLVPISSTPAFALSVDEYFSYTLNVEFSKTEIQGNEVFYATVEGTATCEKDLPVPLINGASMTYRIIAEHEASGAKVTLNPSFTATVDSFPTKQGETAQSSEVVPLQFPSGSQSGTYSVIGELIKAEVRLLIVWFDVTEHLPGSQIMGSVTYVSDSGAVVGGGGGGGGKEEEEQEPAPPEPSLPPGTTDVSDLVSADGTFTETVVTKSSDGKCRLTINEGTKGLSREGKPLTEITMTEMEDGPAPPENFDIVGLTHDLGPDGATFDPPITLTITYDESLMPEGVAEENLLVAMWDEVTDEWVMLVGCAVHPWINIITAPVSHFTAFTILVYTGPAAFVASDLSITPAEINIGEEVTINTLINNTAALAGSYEVILRIDNVVVATKEVTLAAGSSEEVTFTIAKDFAGTYTVTVDGLSGTFVVRGPAAFVASDLSITPAEVDIGEEVTINTLISNIDDLAGSYKVTLKIDNVVVATKEVTLEGGASQQVTFTTAMDVAGTYTVNVDGLSAKLTVKTAPVQAIPMNWALIVGIIAGVIIVCVAVWLMVRHRMA